MAILTISELLENVKKVGERIFNANGYEFQRGFNMCYGFFETQLKNTHLYSQSYLVEQIKDLQKQSRKDNEQSLQMAKVSTVAVLAVQNESIDKVKELQKQVDKQAEWLKDRGKHINENKLLQDKIFSLENRLARQESLPVQKQKVKSSTDKKYKKVMDFIRYMDLEEQLKEFKAVKNEDL